MIRNILLFYIIISKYLFLSLGNGEETSYQYDAFAYFFNIQRRPTMYVYGVDSYPVLLFADAFLGGECVTWTSRFRSDGRENYDFSKLSVRFQLHGVDIMLFDPPYKVWESNTAGLDTPVRQIQFCNPALAKIRSLVMFVQYADEPVRQFTLLRFSLPKVEAAACTMSSLKDLWSARAWVEHHRNLGIDRFNIYINSVIPSPVDKSLSSETKAILGYLLYQKDIVLIEWPFDFKDPNTTRDKVTAPLHYARPLEWNSCNEREHYGSSIVLFNDMDEFVVSNYPLLKVVRSFPETCRGVHLGQYWTKVMCTTKRSVGLGLEIELGTDLDATRPAFDSLNSLRSCKMMHDPNFVIDPKRRAKMLVRSERDDIHDIFNHDLSTPLPDECKVNGKNLIAFQYHIINLRPNHEHASASKFASIKQMIKQAVEVVDVERDFYPYRRSDSGVLSNYDNLEKERLKTGGNKAMVVASKAKETNKNEIVFESFPSKKEIKTIKKEIKKQNRDKKRDSVAISNMVKNKVKVSEKVSKNIDGFDEIDRYFASLNKSPKKNSNDKSSSGSNKGKQVARKIGFDFEKEFRETGELKPNPLTAVSTPEYFIRKGNAYLFNKPKEINSPKNAADALSKVEAPKSRNKRGKHSNSRKSKKCPFPISLPKQHPRSAMMKEGIEIFPIQYAFQQQRMPRELRQVLYDWSIIWPVQSKSRMDNKRGYIFEDEAAYYKEYGTSIFAYTYRKGGWESMRHYEILCNGAIPYFIDIDKMPPHTMTRFPKELIVNTMQLPGINPIAGTLDYKKTNVPCLHEVRQTLLEYCRQNLTTKALAKYFLSAMGKLDAKKVLMINGRQQWEYLTDSLFHGLRSLLGSGFVDFYKRLYMYKGFREKAIAQGFKEYGKGFSYAYALPDDKNIERDPETIRRQIKSKYFDIVIFGQLFQPINLPLKSDWETSTNLSQQLFWKEVSASYKKDEIAFLDGLDYHKSEQRNFLVQASKFGTLFVREIDRHVLKGVDISQSWIPGSETAKIIWEQKMKLEENKN